MSYISYMSKIILIMLSTVVFFLCSIFLLIPPYAHEIESLTRNSDGTVTLSTSGDCWTSDVIELVGTYPQEYNGQWRWKNCRTRGIQTTLVDLYKDNGEDVSAYPPTLGVGMWKGKVKTVESERRRMWFWIGWSVSLLVTVVMTVILISDFKRTKHTYHHAPPVVGYAPFDGYV